MRQGIGIYYKVNEDSSLGKPLKFLIDQTMGTLLKGVDSLFTVPILLQLPRSSRQHPLSSCTHGVEYTGGLRHGPRLHVVAQHHRGPQPRVICSPAAAHAPARTDQQRPNLTITEVSPISIWKQSSWVYGFPFILMGIPILVRRQLDTDAGNVIFQLWGDNTMPADALAPKVARASAGMVLVVRDRLLVLLFLS